jgi:hypothetical protein
MKMTIEIDTMDGDPTDAIETLEAVAGILRGYFRRANTPSTERVRDRINVACTQLLKEVVG